MKKIKQIIACVRAENEGAGPGVDLLWQLICYSPKMPVRLQQQFLLEESEKLTLQAYDAFFTKSNLTFKGFKWGNGSRLIVLTHGWGSKAADFAELITELRTLPDITVIAFDAPGNGSSEGELSNGDLFARAVEAIIERYGMPDVLIGHSLGGMANVLALIKHEKFPALLISITPLIRLKENFEASMTAAGVAVAAQQCFLESFKKTVGVPASYYDLEKLYRLGRELNHLLLYDEADLVSPYPYIEEFLSTRPFIRSENYPGAGHERIIRSPAIIANILAAIAGMN